jgi:predicted NUDIX family phosphoesterase
MYLEDENIVNQMHLGLYYLFDLDGSDVKMIEKGLETIGWVDKKYLKKNFESLTFWSKLMVEELVR